MTLSKAIQRLTWRLENGKFSPNQADADSLEFITNWINRQKQQEIQENRLFAKMYIYCFKQQLEFYQDINFAQKKTHELLKISVYHHCKSFTETLNRVELNTLHKHLGLSDKHPAIISETEKEKDSLIIEDNQEELIKYVLGRWDVNKVTKSLENQLTEAINHYKNHD